jgi:hypothetical protein
MKTSKGKEPGKPKKSSAAGKTVINKKVAATKSGPGEEEIREKAKEIYQQRIVRGEHGTALNDWLKAEELLKGPKQK